MGLVPSKEETLGNLLSLLSQPCEDTARGWLSTGEEGPLWQKLTLREPGPWTTSFQKREKGSFCCLSHPVLVRCHGSAT